MGGKRIHFNDQYGAICGAFGGQMFTPPSPKPLAERAEEVRGVTCIRCARKLTEYGFALQSFGDVIRDVLSDPKCARCMRVVPRRIAWQTQGRFYHESCLKATRIV